MGANVFYRNRQRREDYADIQAAGRKRSLWGSIGGALGAALLLGITGSAAAPVVMGLMAGGGSFLGGHLGNYFAGKTKGGKVKGRRWYTDLADEVASSVKERINVSALQTGGKAALFAAGGNLFAKGGGATTAGGAAPAEGSKTLGRFFKAGDTGKQTGFGKLIDFRGSAIGSRMYQAKLGSLYEDAGWVNPEFQTGVPGSKKIIAMDRRDPSLLINQRSGMGLPPSQNQLDVLASSEPVFSKIDVGPQIPDVTAPGGQLSVAEQKQYDILNRVSDRGGTFDRVGDSFIWGDGSDMAGSGMTTQGQIKSIGVDAQGNLITPPERPNVPLDLGEDSFDMGFLDQDIPETDFSTFDEASWTEGQNTLSRIDAQMQNKLESTSRYYHPRNDPSIGKNRYKNLFGR